MTKKVVVAMSGGVDSSVAAALLKEQGYDVYGVTMRLADWESREGRTFGGCCGSKDFYDARSVAQTLGIPHYSFDYVDKFRGSVIGYFKESYLKGETPNPCIACNQHVKFDALLEKAIALGADYLATGHYARIESLAVTPAEAGVQSNVLDSGFRRNDGAKHVLLKKALDPSKDQSYVLYGLGQKELSRLLFPLGGLAKTEVREIARRYGLRTADKPDSYEICFVPNDDYRQFITEEIPSDQRPSGPIRHTDGRLLGEHRGLPYYTIGQREGLGIAVGHPLYVTAIDTGTNTLVVGEKEEAMSRSMTVRQVSWVSGTAPQLPCEITVKIRSKHTEGKAVIASEQGERGDLSGQIASSPSAPRNDGFLVVDFAEPQNAVTPGQAAVFYNGDMVLGGGIIDRAN
jgi:tRNA-specific 2-thiouridylase